MRLTKSIPLLAALFLVLPAVHAQKAQKLDSLFNDWYDAGKFHGSVLVAEGGKVLYQKTFGLANEETKEKLTADSPFELASVSKQFTAMGIVILKERGKLSYDDDITKHIPELKVYTGVTVRHLLWHTGGLADYMDLFMGKVIKANWKEKGKILDNAALVKLFAKFKPKPDFAPGEKWDYSNTGYALLSVIIERASGSSYADFLKENIFKPLNMEHTFVYNRRYRPRQVAGYAYGYVYSGGQKKFILPDDEKEGQTDLIVYCLDGITGDGTVNSTAADLYKWDRALYTDALVPKAAVDEIFTVGKLANGEATSYGFGWQVSDNKVFGKIAKHSGGWPGYVTYIERHMDNDKVIILLQNHYGPAIRIPHKPVRQILYGIVPAKFITLPKEELGKFAGEYKTSEGKEKKVLFENDKLFVSSADGTRMELKPISSTKFIVDRFEPEVQYEFFLNGNTVERVVMNQPETGNTWEAKR